MFFKKALCKCGVSRNELSAHSSPSYLIIEYSIKFEIIILQDYIIPSSMKSLLNRLCNSPGYLSSQNLIASYPRLCEL